MKLRSILSALLLTAGVAAAPTAKSAIIMSLQQVGSDVLGTASGSADTTGFVLADTGHGGGSAAFFGQLFFAGPSGSSAHSVLVGLSGPSSFGTLGYVPPTSSSGSVIGVDGPSELWLPTGYISGSALSATMTFASTTLSGMGLTNGTYTWTWGSGANADSLTLYIGVPVPSAVPLPASLLLLATGVAAAASLRRRKTT